MNKPRIKTQDEIINSQIQPYEQAGYGNPNFKENPNEDETGIPHNRGKETSFSKTNTKPFTIGLQDIDEAIFYYFNNVIQPYVHQNGERIVVPVEYSSPEKWKSYKKDGYFRDKNGAMMLPIIVLKRDSFQKDRAISNKLDANNPKLTYSFQSGFSKRNSYNNFNVLNDIRNEKELYAVVMPDYVTLTYSCIIQTYYMEQLNKIVEAINYSSDSYWGDPKRFKFMSLIDSINTTTEINSGNDRFVKGSFDIKIKGYIIPDVIQKDMNSNMIYSSKTNIKIGSEIVNKIN